MTTYTDSRYKIFRVSGLPPGLFGLTYVVAVGIHTSGDYFKGEYHILTSRPPALHQDGFRFSAAGVPADLLTVDLDFIVQEAVQQAQIFILDKIDEKATELKKPDLLALPVEFKESPSPFAGFRLRGEFEQQIVQIRSTTECEVLERYLGYVLQLKPVFKQS